jgi:Cu-Zn family superoxide dismutase
MAKASCVLTGVGEDGVRGVLSLSQLKEDAPTTIEGEITGLRPGKHGFHIHVFGDFCEGLVSGGGIFNPFSKNHGAPDDEQRMVGDLGNIEADEEGVCKVHIEDRLVKLIGPHSIIGRSIIVKAGEDDLGRGGHELSLSTGNSGARVAGGIVGIAASK